MFVFKTLRALSLRESGFFGNAVTGNWSPILITDHFPTKAVDSTPNPSHNQILRRIERRLIQNRSSLDERAQRSVVSPAESALAECWKL